MGGKTVSVILPTYNERESIVPLIKEVKRALEGYDLDIWVVDDNSPDGTAEAVLEEFKRDEEINVIKRTDERGLASAIRRGIEVSSGEKIVIMDTDFNHSPEYLPMMLEFSNYFDVVIGSRYVFGGGMDTSKLRFIGSYLFNNFIKFVLWMRTNDNLSGFLAIKRDILKEFDMDRIFYGYGDYCIRLLYYAHKRQVSIVEVPVVYRFRMGGESKTNFAKYLLSYTLAVLKLRITGWKED
ncbi:MAG: glycosyltransferase [Synergistetes bacterium]|nr:glycosyltransferase [Synergistota bacterium]